MARNSTIVFVGVVPLAVGGGLVFTGLVDRGTFTFSGSEDENEEGGVFGGLFG